LLQPDWSALTRPKVYLAALGQAFFSIGLAMGVMVTYGSYVVPQRRLPRAAYYCHRRHVIRYCRRFGDFPCRLQLRPRPGEGTSPGVCRSARSVCANEGWGVGRCRLFRPSEHRRTDLGGVTARSGGGLYHAPMGLVTSTREPGANILLPLNGLLIAVFLGWIWHRRDALAACDLPSSRLGRFWYFSVRYTVPLLVAVVLVRSAWRS